MLCSLFLAAGGASAAGPGPVFLTIKASGTDVSSGDTVFLTTRITSSADILGNPTVSYLFPDGSPGPTVSFSRVGGSLRDGEWQATLPLSQQLPSGTYVVGELRAADVTGNITVVSPDESLMGSANLNVTNDAQEPGFVIATNDEDHSTILKNTTPSRPAECNTPHPRGPFFTSLRFSKTSDLAPGESITVFARIIDCDTARYDFAGASIRLRYVCNDFYMDGPYTTWVRNGTGSFDYKATLTLFNPSPCKATFLTIKELRAWDGMGYDNYFYLDKPYWPTFDRPRFR